MSDAAGPSSPPPPVAAAAPVNKNNRYRKEKRESSLCLVEVVDGTLIIRFYLSLAWDTDDIDQ